MLLAGALSAAGASPAAPSRGGDSASAGPAGPKRGEPAGTPGAALPSAADARVTGSAGPERLDELALFSQALVAKAGSGSAPAHEFRIEARMYRELLRRTMLDSRERPRNLRPPRELLLHMTRMSALLHAAADCKTGFVITCPADLMIQLRSQQERIEQDLQMYRMMSE